MVAVPTDDGRTTRLRPGARGRYAPPPQLFPLALPTIVQEEQWLIERDPEGAWLVRRRDTGRLVARTADPATLQRLLATLASARRD